jgi:hypothetical protein
MSRYRLYFDETGVHLYNKLDSVQGRYLALCGAIFEETEYLKFQVEWEKLKRQFFHGDPDEPIILHRKELMSKSGIFSPLADEATRLAFNRAFLQIVEQAPFTSLLVVIDKARHQSNYQSPWHPYHYCLVALLQRYGLWLNNRRGDIMGESRGRVEDEQLMSAYSNLYSNGCKWHRAPFYQQRFTSKEIKLWPKIKNVAGLQLADLLAHPAKMRCLCNHQIPEVQESEFGKLVADVFWKKIRTRASGKSAGFGEVFI